MSGNMINSSSAVTVRPTNDKEVSSNEIVKQDTKPSHSGAKESEGNENSIPKTEDDVNKERRGVKRPIETDDYADEDDQNSFDSEQFKEELDDDSSGDKVWDDFQGFRKQRGGRLSRTYGLRPRTGIRRAWVDGEAPPTRGASRRGRGRASALKSKYRRNTANARERDRMKEINVAFANLRGALPSFTCRRITSMTKIKTLKLAASYIRALSDLLSDSPSEESKTLALQLFQDIPEQNSFVNSMRHTLDTNVNTFEAACGSQTANSLPKNVSVVSTPTMNVVTSRASSALEAALTNTSKRPSYSMDQGQRYFSQGHHLASRPNFVPPPPLQLPNMSSMSNLHASPTQHSPLLSTYPVSPAVPSNSDCSHFTNFASPSSTIITANVNVIPLRPECSSDQMNMLTPSNSPVSNKTYAPHSSYSSSSSLLSMTYMQSNANEFGSNSTASVPESSTPRTYYRTKTSISSISPDVYIQNQSPSPSYSFNEQINQPYKSRFPDSKPISSQTFSQSTMQVHASPGPQTFYNDALPHLKSAGAVHQIQVSSHQPSEGQPTGSAHNFLRNLAPKNALSPLPSAVETNLNKHSVLNEVQFTDNDAMKPPNCLVQESPFFPGGHSFSSKTQAAASAGVPSTTAAAVNLPESSQGLQEPPDSNCPSWNTMNVELNTLLEDSDCVQDETSLNWDELCWSLG